MIYKLEPIFKERIWGNKEISFLYDLPYNKYAPIGEAWILSCLPKNLSKIDNSSIHESLNSVFKKDKNIVKKGYDKDNFPLLIKYIDSRTPLSIQVHPSTKNEFWYILECKKNSYIYYGFKKEMTKEKVEKAIKDGTICNYLNKIYVKPGDCFYIPAGTIHAIGKDIFLAEVQQSCDITYRVFDYNRLDQNGEPRELHIKEALECINYSKTEVDKTSVHCKPDLLTHELVKTPYFKVQRISVRGTYRFDCDDSSFHFLTVLNGFGIVNSGQHILQAKKTDAFFVSSSHGKYSFSGKADLIFVTL